MEIIFHWHSFVEIQDEKKIILIDPFIEWNKWCDITYDNLLDISIDAIIVTHGHDDHIWSTVELALATNCLVICTFELWIYFDKIHWLKNISTQWIWWSVKYEWYTVKFFQAIHWWWIGDSSSWYSNSPAWVIVSLWNKSIYHAWDTALFSDMRLLEKMKLSAAFLPIWDRYTMWVEDAVEAASLIKSKYVVPMHYNTRDVIKADDIEFARLVMLWNHWVPKVLKPGQALVL